jgi:lactate dehydrogenase-like 2-hydroxyacid dehydrogenase
LGAVKPEIIIVGPTYQNALDRLDAEFTTHKLWLAPDKDALVAKVAANVRGIATTGNHGAFAKLIDALPRLEVISWFDVGYDAVDIDAAKRRKISVSNTPDVLNDCVADLAIGMMMNIGRKITLGDRHVRAGQWLKAPLPLATRVSGKRLGILGYGRIGRAIAKRAAAFDMSIAHHSRNKITDSPHAYHASAVELARHSDFMIVITPGGKETFHLVNEAVIKALGPKGFVINVSRGSVVDEAALLKCLQDGSIGGAALDVFEQEPKMDEAFWTLDNVLLQPHVGSATHKTRAAMGNLTVDNLLAHFSGRPVMTPVC